MGAQYWGLEGPTNPSTEAKTRGSYALKVLINKIKIKYFD